MVFIVIIRKHKSRHITIIAGDFNAKVGERKNDKLNHQVVGKYGKGISNNNGNHLLNFSKVNNLKISNTFFKHTLSQRTTWESPNVYQRECILEKQPQENNQQRCNNIKEVLSQTSKEETRHVKKRFL